MTALLVAVVLAQARHDVPIEQIPKSTTSWYAIHCRGEKVGWLRTTSGLAPDGSLVFESFRLFRMTRGGKATDETDERRITFDPKPPYAVRSARAHVRAGGIERKTTVRREGHLMYARLDGDDRNLGEVDFTFADVITPALWMQRGPRGRIVVRGYDFAALRPTRTSFELRERVDDRYVVRSAVAPWGRRADIVVGTDGIVLSRREALCRYTLQDEKEATSDIQALDADALRYVPVDRKLGDPSLIRELVLAVFGPLKVTRGARQQLRGGTLRLGRRFATRRPASADEIDGCLGEHDRYPIKDKRIVALAKQATRGVKGTRVKVRMLVYFVFGLLEPERAEYDTALDVLKAGKGDCTEFACLFVALARAAGIPAREVLGYVYGGDEIQAFAGHCWAEVVIDGEWVPVDPSWCEVEINATHIAVAGNHDWEKACGKLRFRVLETKHR